jgi:hypothetical protein
MTRFPVLKPDDAEVRSWQETIRRDGVVALPDFYSPEDCAEMKIALDSVNEKYPAALHHASDRRIWGVEKASPVLARFATEPQALAAASAVLGERATCVFTLGNRINFREGNLGSGEGWHRDSFFNQFKALVYLTDVTERTGPFEYLLGTHRLARKFGDHFRVDMPLDTSRVSVPVVEALIAAMPENHRVFTATRGTVLLFDSTGVHRGRPLQEGERIALTNYYYPARDITERLYDHFKPVLGQHVSLD